jgi:hypothetical protein
MSIQNILLEIIGTLIVLLGLREVFTLHAAFRSAVLKKKPGAACAPSLVVVLLS